MDTKPCCMSGWLCTAAFHMKTLWCASRLTQPFPITTEGAEYWGSSTSDSVLPLGRDPGGNISSIHMKSHMTSSNFKRTGKHHPPMFREGEGNSVLVSDNNVFHNFMLVIKNPPANAGGIRDAALIPGLRRSPGGGQGNRLQYSCLENPMD